MKIRTASGEVIDLAMARDLVLSLCREGSETYHRRIRKESRQALAGIIDALEAALRVPRRGMWDKGDPVPWNAALDAVEEAAGVVEDKQ